MVVRSHLYWFRMLLAWRGLVLSQFLPRLLLIFLMSSVVIAVHAYLLPVSVNLNTIPFSLVGTALTVFLGFRNNVSYDRYREARKLWGQLFNTVRSLTCQAPTLPHGDDTNSLNGPNSGTTDVDVREFAQVLGALSYMLCHQLHHTGACEDLTTRLSAALLERVMAACYRPIVIVQWMGEWVQRRVQVGAFDGYAALAFDRNPSELLNSIGGCERIAGTLLPFAYSVVIYRTVYSLCAVLLFGLAESIGSFTPVFAVFVTYTFMAREAIAPQLEDSFGTEDNSLALSTLSNMIEDAAFDILGEPSLLPRAGIRRGVILD